MPKDTAERKKKSVKTHKANIERDLLESLIVYPAAFIELMPVLTAALFTPENVKIVESMHELVSNGFELNLVNLARFGDFEKHLLPVPGGKTGDPTLLAICFAEAVAQEQLQVLKQTIRPDDPDVFSQIGRIASGAENTLGLLQSFHRKTKAQSLAIFVEHLKQRNEGKHPRYPTGIRELDHCLRSGFANGDYCLLTGEPGVGKTSLILNIALHMVRQNFKVGIIEGEMTANQVLLRLAAIDTHTSMEEIERQPDIAERWAAGYMKLPLEISYSYDRRPTALIGDMARLRHAGCKVIFVDYLQVYASKSGKSSDDFSAITKISELLRGWALREDTAVLAVSSQNRQGEGVNKLYGSSGLGYDASHVLIAELDDADNPHQDTRTGTLKLVKNRDGYRGEVPIIIDLPTQTIRQVDEAYAEPHAGTANRSLSTEADLFEGINYDKTETQPTD